MRKQEAPRVDRFVFTDHWLSGYSPRLPEVPVILFRTSTSLEGGEVVRFTGEHPLGRSYKLPLPQFLEAAKEMRDLRLLGDSFPQEEGFERDSNRTALVDLLNKPVWFAFDELMVSSNRFEIDGQVIPESDREGLLSRITGIPVERGYVLVLQIPTKTRLWQSGLVYSAR